MKRLIVIRHAKSSWDSPAQDDFERPLNDRGLRDAPVAAARLEQFLNGEYVGVESSPAERAKMTAEILSGPLTCNDIVWNEDIYLCAPATWLEIIQLWDNELQTGITIGHNPGATTLVNRLTTSQIDNLPTCAMAVIEFEVDRWSEIDWGMGRLVWFDYPKLHRA
ncbi:MAG: histidine phosphatase family protein [Verrucomicrobiota bacterium]